MKLIALSICNFFESVGRARAAAHLATHGHYELAKQIMVKTTG